MSWLEHCVVAFADGEGEPPLLAFWVHAGGEAVVVVDAGEQVEGDLFASLVEPL